MESPQTPPPHPPSRPFLSPDQPALPTGPQKRHQSRLPDVTIHTAINPRLPYSPKVVVSIPASARQMPASSSSQPPSNHLGVMFGALRRNQRYSRLPVKFGTMLLPIPTEEADSDVETIPGEPTQVPEPVEEEYVTCEEDNETDSDSFDLDALYIDKARWMAERKLCSNTTSFSVSRCIDSVPVNVRTVESTFVCAGNGRYVDLHARPNYRFTKRPRPQNRSDIEEVYRGQVRKTRRIRHCSRPQMISLPAW